MNNLLSPVSYPGIVILLILTGSGLPLPEEVPIITAGVLAGQKALNPWLAAVCCLFGAVAGDCMMYFIGYRFGRDILQRHAWWMRYVTPEREAKVERMFKEHGLKVFFIARFLVVVRSPLLLAAGILRVPFRRFLLIDMFSASVVVSTFFGLSYLLSRLFHENWEDIYPWIRTTEVLLTIAAVIAMAVLIPFFWRRYHRRVAAANKGSHGIPAAQTDDAPPTPDDSPTSADKVEEVA